MHKIPETLQLKEWLYKVSGPLVQDSGALQLKEWLYKVSGPPVHDLRINSVELVVVQDFRTTTAEKVVAQGFRTARRGGRGKLFIGASCATPYCSLVNDCMANFIPPPEKSKPENSICHVCPPAKVVTIVLEPKV